MNDTRFEFGVCDVRENYKFYFKWLLSKVMNCIVLKNVPETVDVDYVKEHLILDGNICFTKFNDKLYACIGNRGGQPNEYYEPTQFIIANPVLGSKTVDIGKDGVVVYNTRTDKSNYWIGGLFQLIKQTATLLADNVVSINCNQINSRVETIFTADSEAEAVAGETILRKLYDGHPYQIVRQNILEKININPISGAATTNKLGQLIELHQYIIAQFYQAVGIKSNAINKKERLITDEINSQDDNLGMSLLDMVTSWKQGFDEVNEMFGTAIEVEINPILEHVVEPSEDSESTETNEDSEDKGEQADEAEPSEDSEDEADEVVEEAIDTTVKEGETDE